MISTRFLVSGFGRLVRVGGDGGLTGSLNTYIYTCTALLVEVLGGVGEMEGMRVWWWWSR